MERALGEAGKGKQQISGRGMNTEVCLSASILESVSVGLHGLGTAL